MYKLRIIAQSIVALFVAVSAMFQMRGYGRVPAVFTLLACVATLWLVSCRTTWLPFLGPSAMPVGILRPYTPSDADAEYKIPAPRNAIRIVYWGSSIKAKDPILAYGGYANAGIADVVNGTALIRLRKPKEYCVWGRKIEPHVHYRWVTARGILSSVKTLKV